ncbi:MAG TPA: hypothetical protein VES97_09515 [Solirubrobacteraceae bacterium]|nr:hypothetical protein [Solirubrobacteraceae bacterium]
MSYEITQVLRDLRPDDATRTDEIFPGEQRIELLEAILSHDARSHRQTDVRRRHTQRKHRHRFSGTGWLERPVLVPALGVVAAVAVAVAALATSSAVTPQPAAGAVAFRAAPGGNIVATVTDPFAAVSQLKSAFARRGFDITLDLVPVSPSLVGTVVYSSDAGGSSAIQPLQRGQCLNAGGGCSIGVEIPASFVGKGYITLGRPARPGETYESQASAFAPGEPLHCSGLLGRRVAAAQPALEQNHLTVEWREVTTETATDGTQTSHSKTDIVPASSNYIWDADMTAPGKVAIWTEPTPWPADTTHGAQFNQGC